MTNQNDPITCSSCGTVNPWLNEQCRDCGAFLKQAAGEESSPITEPEVEDSNSETETPKAPRRRWNILWIVLGIFFYLAAMWIGEALIAKWVIAPNAELKEMVEKVTLSNNPDSLSDGEQEKLRSLLLSNATFVTSVLLLMFGTPLFIGVVIGYFTNSVLEGAAAMGLSAVIIFMSAGQAGFALGAAPISAVLGAAGAVGGNILRQRIQRG